jgi:PPOX class probable F420-dependent enzyme
MIDTTTAFGARVARRLEDERIIWLVTVDPQQTPQPLPVWYWWDGHRFLMYSQPDTFKLRNIAHNPRVGIAPGRRWHRGRYHCIYWHGAARPDSPACQRGSRLCCSV